MSDSRSFSNLLFSFDSIFDLDLAMIKYFKMNFADSKYIDTDILKNDDLKYYQAMLRQRPNKNPLSIILKDKYKDQADSLYNEIYNKYTIKIILLCSLLSFAKIISYLKDHTNITSTILCKNEYEEHYCNRVFSDKVKTIQRSSKDFVIDNYDALYLKDIDDLSLVLHKATDVYVLSYTFNMEKGIDGLPKLDAYGKMLSSLKIHFAEPYGDYIKPI